MAIVRIAILMTCYNRRNNTIACLEALANQKDVDDVIYKVYLVDDGSIDGTGDAVRKHYPRVKILQGDGNLFWNGGMRMAFEEAMKKDYDYYLWLNDDTTLFPQAIRTMLGTSQIIRTREGQDAIIAGSSCDPKTGKRTYGGVMRVYRLFSIGFRPLEPSEIPLQCETMNGNCVLIPRKVAKSVGNLSEDYTHGIGDYDYGLRAKAMGFSSWITPGYICKCPTNPHTGTWFDPKISLKKRREKMAHPTGLLPEEYLLFVRRYGGIRWVISWLKLKLRLLFPRFWQKLRKWARIKWIEH